MLMHVATNNSERPLLTNRTILRTTLQNGERVLLRSEAPTSRQFRGSPRPEGRYLRSVAPFAPATARTPVLPTVRTQAMQAACAMRFRDGAVSDRGRHWCTCTSMPQRGWPPIRRIATSPATVPAARSSRVLVPRWPSRSGDRACAAGTGDSPQARPRLEGAKLRLLRQRCRGS